MLLRRLLSNLIKASKTMSPKRYFPNRIADYTGTETVTIPLDEITKQIWFLSSTIDEGIERYHNKGHDGLYLGTAGIAYMYYCLHKHPTLTSSKHLKTAIKYLAPAFKAIKKSRVEETPSFILGPCGVYALAAVLFQKSGDLDSCHKYTCLFYNAADICKGIDFLECGSDELFVGRAGFILGALWMEKEANISLKKPIVYTICDRIIESGRNYALKYRSECPLMYSYYGVEYLGAAHGLCTILLALISVPGYLESRPEYYEDIRASVDYLLGLQTPDGNFPCTVSEIGAANALVHWCHGAGGMIYLMARAYLVWSDDKYLESCKKMGELIWAKGLLKKGPGICHGVAGNGYAFLILYRLTQENVYLHRAVAFCKFLEFEEFIKGARIPDNPYSLFEGFAGTNCFLADLIRPDKAAFPFLDVF